MRIVVYITKDGLETYWVRPKPDIKEIFKRTDDKKKRGPIEWYLYSVRISLPVCAHLKPYWRLLVMASGSKANTLQCLPLTSSTSSYTIPKFTVEVSQTLQKSDIFICQLYEKIYCIHTHHEKNELHLYLLTKDKVWREHVIDVSCGTTNISLSSVGNLLVVHSKQQKVSVIYDICAPKQNDKTTFLVSPLPLMLSGNKSIQQEELCKYHGSANGLTFRLLGVCGTGSSDGYVERQNL